MDDTWLVFDVSSLAYAAYHVIPDNDVDDALSWQIVRMMRSTYEMASPGVTVFCFDGGYECRLRIYPRYKLRRKKNYAAFDDEERRRRRCLRRVIYRLRDSLLEELGFSNILWQEEYEADDLVAAVCDTHSQREREIIVASSDSDLYQCLEPSRVLIWNFIKKRMTTAESFTLKYGISPSQWADVKALSGCSSDDVEGIRQIGEKRAIQFLNGTLRPGTGAYDRIVMGQEVWQRNLKLVTLPFPGVELPDVFAPDGNPRWEEVLSGLKPTRSIRKRSWSAVRRER
jgi:5'-3' exonuclease